MTSMYSETTSDNTHKDGDFIVTEDAMRPASDKRQCFYCHQPIGAPHASDCVLIQKRAKVRMTVDYIVTVPSDWGKDDVEFQRNEGSWCSDNAIRELADFASNVKEQGHCLCPLMEFEYLGDESGPFLCESGKGVTSAGGEIEMSDEEARSISVALEEARLWIWQTANDGTLAVAPEFADYGRRITEQLIAIKQQLDKVISTP